jgi:hypothetical protein
MTKTLWPVNPDLFYQEISARDFVAARHERDQGRQALAVVASGAG